MSLRHLWAFLAVALPMLAALIASLPATDLAYHLRAGDEIMATGRIPTVDSWTFTIAGEPWLDQQWGAQLVLTTVYDVAGWTGLVLFRAALVGATSAAILELSRRQGVGIRTAAWLTLGAFAVAAPAMALRPQLIAMALFAGTLLIVSDRADHPRRLWAVPVIAIAWANVHGSFLLAPLVLALAWLGDIAEESPRRHLTLVIAAVTAVTCCVTPFGPAVWLYALQIGANPAVTGLISEWQATSIRNVEGILFYGSALLVAGYLARRGQSAPWPALLWLGVFFIIGAYAARGLAWWPYAAVAALAPLIATDRPAAAEREPEIPRQMRLANVVVAVVIIVASVALLPVWRPIDPDTNLPQGVLSQAPPGLSGAVREAAAPGDRLLVAQPWASWFEFAMPDLAVAVDSRVEIFPDRVWADYFAVTQGAGDWNEILSSWDPALIVTDDGSFSARLVAKGWTELHADDDGTVLGSPDTGRSVRTLGSKTLLESAQ